MTDREWFAQQPDSLRHALTNASLQIFNHYQGDYHATLMALIAVARTQDPAS